MKEKFQLEYVLNNVSINILWNSISTPNGLAEWFADKVSVEDNIFTFQWGKSSQSSAELIHNRTGSYMQFHWEGDEPKTYFEFRITLAELTNDVILTITDFALPEEKEESITLWNNEVAKLRKAYGM
jgi:hypothetical protein